MSPKVIAFCGNEKSLSVWKPGFKAVAFAMKAVLHGDTAVAGNQEYLHAAIAVAAES
jgi:hypothetical protein